MSPPKVVIVIPARYGSTRLAGKPLISMAGKPMIQRVYERAKLAEQADRVIVATDDQRVVKAVEGFGGEARMTRTDHRTGTERVAEVAAHVAGEGFVNVQGDEPLLDFENYALYFSRAPIPWVRDAASKIHVRHLKHLGLYVFQRDALLEYPTLPQGELERVEQLEQLRWLENGWRIRVAEVEHGAVSVDVPEDVARVEKLLQK